MARNLWVAAYDVHAPEVDKPTLAALLDFLQKNKKNIAGFVFGGDQLTNNEISHWTAGKPLHRPPGAFRKNTEWFNENVLKPVEDRLLPDTEKIWIEGNHDNYEYQLVEKQPELQGLVERPILLGLEDRGWSVIPIGHHYKLGKLLIIHGEALSGIGNQASIYHSKKAVENYGSSVLYGHMHSPQSYTRILPHDKRNKWSAWCAPIVGAVNPGYLRNRPTAWLNGFVIIELHKPGATDSNFNVYPITVSDGRFSFAGEVYGKKA